jgi:hypothetical protein
MPRGAENIYVEIFGVKIGVKKRNKTGGRAAKRGKEVSG